MYWDIVSRRGIDMSDIDLNKLSEYFPPQKIEWKPGVTNANKEKNQPPTKAIALAFVTARAIQDRLDEVCGPDNWKNEFIPWKNDHQLCGISIRINGEWVTKWDGAENTQTEPLKGGLSSAMKRAAAQWGIGRYLYEIPNQWYPVIQKGKRVVFDSNNLPKLPDEFIPKGYKNEGYQIDTTTAEEREILNLQGESKKISKDQVNALIDIVVMNSINMDKLKKWGKVKNIEDLTSEQYEKLIEIYGQQGFKTPQLEKLGVSSEEQERLARVNKKVGGSK
jgi:hypothetical protein